MEDVGAGELIRAMRAAEAQALGSTLDATTLAVVRVRERLLAASDVDGAWAVVVLTKTSAPRPSVQLQTLRVDYGVVYVLDSGDRQDTVRASVLRCRSEDQHVRTLFSRFVVSLLERLPDPVTESQLADEVDAWVRLFLYLQEAPRADVIGIAGELVLIAESSNPEAWVRGWHSSKNDVLDFVLPIQNLSVEVKATSQQQRIHEISYWQARPPLERPSFIASVLVDMRESAQPLSDLVDEILGRIDAPEVRYLLWEILARTSGSALGTILEARMDLKASRESLLFFDALRVPVPAVELPLPPGVSGLRYRCDLSYCEPVQRALVLG